MIVARYRQRFCLAIMLLLTASGAAKADNIGNQIHGQRLFLLCAACHSIEAGSPNKVGPNLFGITGEKAASRRSDFVYSDALKKSGLIWTDSNLDAWLEHPGTLVPGTKMAFAGLPSEQNRRDIIAYLGTEKP